jgi:hypothetical protein
MRKVEETELWKERQKRGKGTKDKQEGRKKEGRNVRSLIR